MQTGLKKCVSRKPIFSLTQADEEEPSVAKAEALKNLQTWSTDRKNWKFSKLRQVWLLKHMYDPEMVRSNRCLVAFSL